MFSVIVPTMWKFEPFNQFLLDLTSVPNVGEIILINNNKRETPDIVATLNHPKIKHFVFDQNIYVNPAWNFGVERSFFNKICIINDDLIFDLKVFHRMEHHVSPLRGVYGMCAGKEEMGQIPVTDGEINIRHCTTPYNHHTHFGYGQFMMFDKRNWTPILQGLDIYWGDNFIYDTMFFSMNQNYHITNMFHYTPYSTTASKLPEHMEMYHREQKLYNERMPSIIHNIRVANAQRTGFF